VNDRKLQVIFRIGELLTCALIGVAFVLVWW
jgi:hypothetical protein